MTAEFAELRHDFRNSSRIAECYRIRGIVEFAEFILIVAVLGNSTGTIYISYDTSY